MGAQGVAGSNGAAPERGVTAQEVSRELASRHITGQMRETFTKAIQNYKKAFQEAAENKDPKR